MPLFVQFAIVHIIQKLDFSVYQCFFYFSYYNLWSHGSLKLPYYNKDYRVSCRSWSQVTFSRYKVDGMQASLGINNGFHILQNWLATPDQRKAPCCGWYSHISLGRKCISYYIMLAFGHSRSQLWQGFN